MRQYGHCEGFERLELRVEFLARRTTIGICDAIAYPATLGNASEQMEMTYSELMGSIGVGLLLLAFGLNIFGWLSRESRRYHGLNVLGAGLACYASWRINYVPFVILEATWAIVALTALARPSQSTA
jgi:hypothetical protein